MIDWSWNLLEEPERAWRCVEYADSRQDFTADAAVAVAQWGEVVDVADALEGLVNQSMLSVVEPPAAPIRGASLPHARDRREFGDEQS